MKRLLAYLTAFCLCINPVVLQAYYRDGGKVSYHEHLMVDGTPCWGVYYWDDKSIRITNDAPDTTLAHEIGHWLYHRQVWSGELQHKAGQAFASSPLRELTDENFALGYAMYCERGLGGELGAFYKEIEEGIS